MTYGITYSRLSGHINIGRINARTEFVTKEDHTTAALISAALCVIDQYGGDVDLTPRDGAGPAYRLTAQRVDT